MAAEGWIKVSREALIRCGKSDKLHAYCDLAARANYTTGEVMCTIAGVAGKWGWSRNKARSFLSWALPMIRETITGEKKDSKWTGDGTPDGTPKGHPKGHLAASNGAGLQADKDTQNDARRYTQGTGDGTGEGPITKKKNKEKEEDTTAEPTGSAGSIENIPPEHKPPTEDKPAFMHFSYKFYLLRRRVEDDQFFNPYDGRHLKNCKQIIEQKAGGNLDEAIRRARNLHEYWKQDPNFWKLLPGELLAKWERLNKGPEVKGGTDLAAAMDAAR